MVSWFVLEIAIAQWRLLSLCQCDKVGEEPDRNIQDNQQGSDTLPTMMFMMFERAEASKCRGH